MEKMTDKDTLADNNIKDFHESPKYAYCDLCAMNGYTNEKVFVQFKGFRSEYEDNDKQFVKEVLSDFADDIHTRIKEITNFHEKYNRVYIKYKHIFSPLIGTTYKDKENEISIPRIFIRDMDKDKITKNKIISTYILSTDNETLDYYEKVANDIYTLFSYFY
jgi:hypothetical protein